MEGKLIRKIRQWKSSTKLLMSKNQKGMKVKVIKFKIMMRKIKK
jgi:hypothetical protein